MNRQIVFGHIREEIRESGRVVSISEVDPEVGFIEYAGSSAEVSVAVGATKNLGDFQSKRVDVSLKLPCNPQGVWEHLKRASNAPAKRASEDKVKF